mmetsp:Transcript_13830/g.35548  ORF Transcript_13830/g.35548 Transcript_13830/m.35548 type:complete len:298 (+) Transcript_13830:132-1025(+)
MIAAAGGAAAAATHEWHPMGPPPAAAAAAADPEHFELPEVWHRPLSMDDFETVPSGACLELHYNSSNQGSFLWTHRKVVPDEMNPSARRLHGSFDGASADGPYLYDYEGHVSRGSGAEPCWNIPGPPKLPHPRDVVDAEHADAVQSGGQAELLEGETPQDRAVAEAVPADLLSAVADRPLQASDLATVPPGAVLKLHFTGRVNGSVWWRHSDVLAGAGLVTGRFAYAPFKPEGGLRRYRVTGTHPYSFESVGYWSAPTSRLLRAVPSAPPLGDPNAAPLCLGGDPAITVWGVSRDAS